MQPLEVTLRGVTNAALDVSVDAFRTTALPLFRAAGATLSLAMPQRAVGPAAGRGGVVTASLTPLRAIEAPLLAVAEGLVRRVRGVAWTVNLGPSYATAAFSAAKGVLLRLLADVQIFTDVVALRAEPVRAVTAGARLHAAALRELTQVAGPTRQVRPR
jgi:RNA 3'-terminal phosphate cyclase-like protein